MMRSDLQRIGNSKGIVIPKAIPDKCGFDRRVEMRVEGNKLILTPARNARAGVRISLLPSTPHLDVTIEAALVEDRPGNHNSLGIADTLQVAPHHPSLRGRSYIVRTSLSLSTPLAAPGDQSLPRPHTAGISCR